MSKLLILIALLMFLMLACTADLMNEGSVDDAAGRRNERLNCLNGASCKE